MPKNENKYILPKLKKKREIAYSWESKRSAETSNCFIWEPFFSNTSVIPLISLLWKKHQCNFLFVFFIITYPL